MATSKQFLSPPALEPLSPESRRRWPSFSVLRTASLHGQARWCSSVIKLCHKTMTNNHNIQVQHRDYQSKWWNRGEPGERCQQLNGQRLPHQHLATYSFLIWSWISADCIGTGHSQLINAITCWEFQRRFFASCQQSCKTGIWCRCPQEPLQMNNNTLCCQQNGQVSDRTKLQIFI